jgi:CheY-like chemotaxis protein
MQTIYLHKLPMNPGEKENPENGVRVTRFPCIVGRNPECNVWLTAPFVSRRHCVLFERDGQVWVRDLGSRNGTFLNGKPLQEDQLLRDGDRLELYHMAFQVHLQGSPAAPVPVPGALDQGREMPPRHVLVVDDNEDTAETMALVLKAWGHGVQVAHDGPAALRAAQAHQPDTVLLDLRLPGMTGYEVAERLRAQPGLENTTLIAITGCDPEDARRRSPQAGFAELLTKPVEPQALREALSHAR